MVAHAAETVIFCVWIRGTRLANRLRSSFPTCLIFPLFFFFFLPFPSLFGPFHPPPHCCPSLAVISAPSSFLFLPPESACYRSLVFFGLGVIFFVCFSAFWTCFGLFSLVGFVVSKYFESVLLYGRYHALWQIPRPMHPMPCTPAFCVHSCMVLL